MTLADALYFVIPTLNSMGNILLKLSVDELKEKNKRRFILRQLSGYSIFGIVMVLSYIFLMTHAANFFVVIFSLNYLSTLYVSRWLLKDAYSHHDVIYDGLVVIGIFIFYYGVIPS